MLEISDLTAGYAGNPVARLPAMSLAAGDASLLVGASGSGKTTLLLAIAGLVERIAGTIAIDGEDVARLPVRQRDRHRGRTIGLVFQDLHLVPGLAAIDNLLLAPFASGNAADRDRAGALLDRLGVLDHASMPAEKLSRGQAQRVAIARALMMRPRVILADEPTASLDDEACATVLGLLTETARESDAALVIATHDARVRSRIGASVTAEAV